MASASQKRVQFARNSLTRNYFSLVIVAAIVSLLPACSSTDGSLRDIFEGLSPAGSSSSDSDSDNGNSPGESDDPITNLLSVTLTNADLDNVYVDGKPIYSTSAPQGDTIIEDIAYKHSLDEVDYYSTEDSNLYLYMSDGQGLENCQSTSHELRRLLVYEDPSDCIGLYSQMTVIKLGNLSEFLFHIAHSFPAQYMEFFLLAIKSNALGNVERVAVSVNMGNIEIEENDKPVLRLLNTDDVELTESDSAIPLYLSLSKPIDASPYSITGMNMNGIISPIGTGDGIDAARTNKDYAALDISFPSGETLHTHYLQVLNDRICEGDEIGEIRLSPPSSSDQYVLGSSYRKRFTILDDEGANCPTYDSSRPTVEFPSPAFTYSFEGLNGTSYEHRTTVRLSEPAGPGGVTVYYSLTTGTSSEDGSDSGFQWYSNSTYIGENESYGFIYFTAEHDLICEEHEAIVFRFDESSQYNIVGPDGYEEYSVHYRVLSNISDCY